MKTNLKLLLRTLLLLFVCSWGMNIFPKEVDVNTAKRVAVNWFSEKTDKSVSGFQVIDVIEEKENGEIIYYIINISEGGYVIVAADDISFPVLGYSFKQNFTNTNLPPGLSFMLGKYKKQILNARKNNHSSWGKSDALWARLSTDPKKFGTAKEAKSMPPLLTTTWGQHWPYNELCPADGAAPPGYNGIVPAGCGALSMAQIMNYWNHCWVGYGSHSYDENDYGTLSADFANTIYNFDSMPDAISTSNLHIATLIYHCGVAQETNYGPDGSSTTNTRIKNAFKDFFYYDDNDIDIIWKSSYVGSWNEKMIEELDNERPVNYNGYDVGAVSGHFWVLDGYQGTDHFHMNWGWGGQHDDYFYLDDLTPGDHNYTNEKAIIGIKPEIHDIYNTLTVSGSPYYYYKDLLVPAGQTLTIEPGVELFFAGRYKLEVHGKLEAIGTLTDSITIAATTPEIGMKGVRFCNLNDYGSDSSKLVYCRFKYGKGDLEGVHPHKQLYGGAIACKNSSQIFIANSEIIYSSADRGGGIACYDTSNIEIKNCVIAHDSSAISGGGIYLSDSDVVLSNNLIRENECYSNGGGVFCNNSEVTFFQDTIRDNTAGYGGGIDIDDSDVVMDSVVIHDNSANVGYGGGIHVFESNLELNNMQLFENTADTSAGGIFCDYNSVVQINKSLIHHNQAPTAPSIYVCYADVDLMHITSSGNIGDPNEKAIIVKTGNLFVENSILWNSTLDEIDTIGSCTVVTRYSTIEDGPWTGVVVYSYDPLFANPYFHDYRLTWSDYPMPDGGKSPPIDSGNPDSPLDPDGTQADMGAIPYEQVYTPLIGGSITGTLTCEGSPYFVDGDLTVLAGYQLVIEPCVYLMFRGYYKLAINGQLLAEGTPTDKITFACTDTITGWRGIRFGNTNSNGQDSSKLINCRISFGYAHGAWGAEDGGGLYFNNSSTVRVENCLISKNRSEGEGGGICCYNSSKPVLVNNTIINNTGVNGGGLYFRVNNTIQGGIIENNHADYGGGLYIYGTNSTLSGLSINNNYAKYGGGIYQTGSGRPTFDTINRCSIYMNYAEAAGLDFYANPSQSSIIHVAADTLTILYPNDYFYYPINRFSFDHFNYVVEQEDQDLYVAMTGSDANSGTSTSDPLKTIHMALKKIIVDEINPRTIFLENGTYSEGATGEILPINPRDYVTISGTDRTNTKIYGEEKSRLLFGYNKSDFTIQNLTLMGGVAGSGGAVRLKDYCSPEFNNVRFWDNEATGSGGAMYCNNESHPVIKNSLFWNNIASGSGGALYCRDGCDVQFIQVNFLSNEATSRGGAIYAYNNCDIVLDSCLLEDNQSCQGGGIYYYRSSSNATVSNTIFRNNYVYKNLYYGFGAAVVIDYSSPVFYNVEIYDNTSERYAGGIYSRYVSSPRFYNVRISNNTATERGGGIYNTHDGNHKYYNCLIDNNTAGIGAGMFADFDAITRFTNVTIANNSCTSGNGGAVYNNSDPHQVFRNSIVWGNSPDGFYLNNGTVNVEYSNLQDFISGTGNIYTDPEFNFGNYTLMESSPCINAGNPDTTGLNIPSIDLAGNPRISGITIDMGAYEYQFTTTGIELDIHALLEGPFNGSNMNSHLAGLLDFPLSQPYFLAPWNYTGSEIVVSLPVDVIDWVLVELRDAPDASSATSATSVAIQAAFIKSDGSVVGLNGHSNLFFPLTPSTQLFAILWHRNHLGIMSAYHLIESGGVYSYDFVTPAGQAYGTDAQKDLGGGIYGLFAGDGNGDEMINSEDKTSVWSFEAGSSGYLMSDFNLDSQTDNADKNDIWIENNGNSSQIPD